MRYGSVCSGIEAATVAWHTLPGWEPAWFSEIEPFPCKVLKHHYPDVPNYGDMTKFKEWPDGPIDLLVGGTPCQSFSIAGLRKGLADPRGNLMLTFGAIADRYRPTWLVWENVPGVLSSNGGKDFGAFLGMLAELGYGFAYRVLDAQYFGVAQRRKRVFVVGYLGDWRPAAAVLFERHSLQGHPTPSRKAGERIAPTVSQGAPFSRTGNERVEAEAMVVTGFESGQRKPCLITHTIHPRVIGRDAGGPEGKPYRDGSVSYTCETSGAGAIVVERVAPPLLTKTRHNPSDELLIPCHGGTVKMQPTEPLYCMATGQGGAEVTQDKAPTLNCNHEAPIVAGPIAFAQNTRDEVRLMGGDGSIVGALSAQPGMKQTCYVAQPIVILEDQGGSVMSVNESGVIGTLRRETHGHEPIPLTMRDGKEGGGQGSASPGGQVGHTCDREHADAIPRRERSRSPHASAPPDAP